MGLCAHDQSETQGVSLWLVQSSGESQTQITLDFSFVIQHA